VPFGIGPLELVIVLLIVLVIVGPKRLPQMGRSLGSGMREFKNGITGRGHKDDDSDDAPEMVASTKTEDVETNTR
jgi:sec-independent protein translocase protein TatA